MQCISLTNQLSALYTFWNEKAAQISNTEFKAVVEHRVQIPGKLPLTLRELEACYKFKFIEMKLQVSASAAAFTLNWEQLP